VGAGASVGAALFPDDGETPAQLLKNADVALYKAKAEGGGGHSFFAAEMRARLERRRRVEDELRLALARGGEVVPFFQPVVRLEDGRVAGFEALARWLHPGRGVVPPAEFVPVAEEAGLSVRLGEAVLRQALALVRAWQDRDLAPGWVAVNVGGAQLRRGGLAATVADALAEAGVAPDRLVVEVTEGVFLGRGAERAAGELEALHALGVAVALDDFGTGHASLTHLRRFPVDELKVDASFVRDAPADPGDAAIVRAVVGLGRGLGLRVVAEGVETAEQAEWLRLQGCSHGQGSLFGAPMPGEAVPGWLRRRRRDEGAGAG
jgi:predicted signal transduction protein with EAL and GGDEF domain